MHEVSSRVKETIAEVKDLATRTDHQFTELALIVNRSMNLMEKIYDMYLDEKARADQLQAKLDGEEWKL